MSYPDLRRAVARLAIVGSPGSDAEIARLEEEARAAWYAKNPTPKVLDFTCPRCKAPPGQPCVWARRRPPAGPARFHLPRQDRAVRAYNRHIEASYAAGTIAEREARR